MRTASLMMLTGLLVQVAHADEIRHATFPNVMLGTWAETVEQCAAKDKTNIVIQPIKYRDGGGDCEVTWIVETAGSDGINYAVHSICTSASLPERSQTKNIVVRPVWPRSRGDGTIVRRSKELSALSITFAAPLIDFLEAAN